MRWVVVPDPLAEILEFDRALQAHQMAGLTDFILRRTVPDNCRWYILGQPCPRCGGHQLFGRQHEHFSERVCQSCGFNTVAVEPGFLAMPGTNEAENLF
jgi:rRNA maturation protein Nop10